MDDDEILGPGAAAKALNLSLRQLQRQHAKNDGPPRVRLTERRIGYRRGDLRAWSAARVESEPPEIQRLQTLLGKLRRRQSSGAAPDLATAIAQLELALKDLEEKDATIPSSECAPHSGPMEMAGYPFPEQVPRNIVNRKPADRPAQGLAMSDRATVCPIDAHQMGSTAESSGGFRFSVMHSE